MGVLFHIRAIEAVGRDLAADDGVVHLQQETDGFRRRLHVRRQEQQVAGAVVDRVLDE